LRALWVGGAVVLQSALDVATPQISFTGHLAGVAGGVVLGALLAPAAAQLPTATRSAALARPALTPRRLALAGIGAAVALAAALALPGRRETDDDEP
ncbi:MAG: hypothetical protein JO326_15070, partial [Acetobacteraceae bacterium]|nr:hypothetical protein [Acetobacteraceae bacterium]